MPSKIILAMVFLTALGLSSSAARAEYRQEIIDSLGRQVVMTAPPRRIVTIFTSNTEMVCALGLVDYIVGVDGRTTFPPELINRPGVGGRLGVSLEQVVAQNPDLVVMTPSNQAVHTLLPPLEKLGITAVVFTSRSVADIMDNFSKLAELTDRSEVGQFVRTKIESRLAQVSQRRLGRTKPKVILIFNRLPSGLFLVARKGGYVANMVELAGGVLALESTQENTLEIMPSLSQISPEALMSVDPDIILFRWRRWTDNELEEYLQRSAFSTLKAHRNGNIYALKGTEFGIPSMRVVDGVETLADIFEKWDKQL